MRIEEWWPWYVRIADLLKLDIRRDQLAADILSSLISKKSIDPSEVSTHIKGRGVLIFGAGPSLDEDIRVIKKSGLLEDCVKIAADGATSGLLELADTHPDIIVTDLDGRVEDQIMCEHLGAVIVVLAHGDNIHRIKEVIPMFSKVLGTTQVEPRPHVHNFGGFTDGDRAAFFAETFAPSFIALAGMDLGTEIGKYSKPKAPYSSARKLLKLEVCKGLLEWLSTKTTTPLYNLTSSGVYIKGFYNISPEKLKRILSTTQESYTPH